MDFSCNIVDYYYIKSKIRLITWINLNNIKLVNDLELACLAI